MAYLVTPIYHRIYPVIVARTHIRNQKPIVVQPQELLIRLTTLPSLRRRLAPTVITASGDPTCRGVPAA